MRRKVFATIGIMLLVVSVWLVLTPNNNPRVLAQYSWSINIEVYRNITTVHTNVRTITNNYTFPTDVKVYVTDTSGIEILEYFKFSGNGTDFVVISSGTVILSGNNYTLWPERKLCFDVTARPIASIMEGDTATIKVRAEVYEVAVPEILMVPENYLTIQEAIDVISPRGTILVSSGTYYEHVVVNKPVTLVGEGSGTVIDGGGTYSVVYVSADNVEVSGFTVRNGVMGVFLQGSRGAIICGNTLTSNIACGINLNSSRGNFILGNTMSNNNYGIRLISSSCDNMIVGNTISNNILYGMTTLYQSNNNIIYHNNIVDNFIQFYSYESSNTWESGAGEGSYWSDYTGVDQDGDGVGDTLLPHLGVDYCPLMSPWISFSPEMRAFGVVWYSQTYDVTTFSNSTVSGFNFTQYLNQTSFDVTGPWGTHGFCNVTIPINLLDGNFTVLIDGVPAGYILTQDAINSHLYFTYNHSTRKVKITGTSVITTVPCDVSGPEGVPDGIVNIFDVFVLAEAWLSSPGDLNWNPDCDFSGPAGTPDGIINIFDVFVLASYWLYGT